MRARVMRMGLATVLGLARRGFFIPHRYADRLAPPGEVGAYAPLEALLREREGEFARLLDEIDARPAVQQGLEVLKDKRRSGPPKGKEWEIMFGKEQFKRH